MVKKPYIPDADDLVWVNFNPTRGREQAKVRPAIVLSPKAYNRKTNLALMCPITSVHKGYPFEVEIRAKKLTGVVLSDHIRSLDWKERDVQFIAKANPLTITEVRAKVSLLINADKSK